MEFKEQNDCSPPKEKVEVEVRMVRNTRCFFCLDKITRSKSGPSPVSSIQCLSRYIKLNFENLEELKSGLQVQLCGGCALINQSFLEFHGQLVKIELEVMKCLNLIHGRMTTTSAQSDEAKGSERILNLREETIKKCKFNIIRLSCIGFYNFLRKHSLLNKLLFKYIFQVVKN